MSHLGCNIRNKIEDLNTYQIKNPTKVIKVPTEELD